MKAQFQKQSNSILNFPCFLGIAGIALFSYVFLYHLKGLILISAGIGFLMIMILFYCKLHFSMPVVRNSITFFLIFYLSYPILYYQIKTTNLSFPGVLYIIPFLVFFILTKVLRQSIGFPEYLVYFKKDSLSLFLLPVIVIISAIGLILWAVLLNPDVSAFFKMIPKASLPILFVLGILFAVSNAFAEELVFRGFLFDGLSVFISRPPVLIVLQAAIFGIWHYKGFPGGPAGSFMVFIWAVFLGIMRYRSKSIWYSIVGHVFADLTIFGLLLLLFKDKI
jgi:membrane protease YdiL (CAAX protease family)